MNKPEYCWMRWYADGTVRVFHHLPYKHADYWKFEVIRNEAGEVIRLERVEG